MARIGLTFLQKSVLLSFERLGGVTYGYPVAKDVGLQLGTVYGMLPRLADAGLLALDRVEQPHNSPARQYYRLTEAGYAWMPQARADLLRLALGNRVAAGAATADTEDARQWCCHRH